MAMTMNGSVTLPADRQTVWDALNDPEVLKACIPGCQELTRTEDDGFAVTAKIKIGPVYRTTKPAHGYLGDMLVDFGLKEWCSNEVLFGKTGNSKTFVDKRNITVPLPLFRI